MKKKLLIAVLTLISVCNVKAVENDVFKIDIPDNFVEDKVEETPVVDEPKPKKTRKKKEVVVEEETDISEEPVNEVPEQTETTEA